MKIAVVTDDTITISRHFGRAKHYLVVTVKDSNIVARQHVEKPVHHYSDVHLHDDHAHGEHGQDETARHAEMFAPLQGCDIVLTRGMGRGAYIGLKQIGVQPIITDIASIEEAIAAVINGTIVDHPEMLH